MGILSNHIQDTQIFEKSLVCQKILKFIDFGSNNHLKIHMTLTLYHFLLVINGMDSLSKRFLHINILQAP